VRLNGGSTLTLQATKEYDIKGELRLLTGATLKSDTPGSSATVLVKGFIFTEAQTFLTDLNLFDLSGPLNNVHFGNGTLLKNVLAVSATGEIHVHTGSQLQGDTEIAANSLIIQPIFNIPPPADIACVCPVGSVPKDGANLFQCRLP
jgi:hypothetical protein